MKRLDPHPFAELLPMMSDAEYASLKADIAANGQADPILTFEGKILDGRNREKACFELNVKPKIEKFAGDGPAAINLVYSRANHRNMNESQKAAAAVNFLPHFEAAAKDRMAQGVEKMPHPVSKPKHVSGKTLEQWRARLNQTGREEMERRFKLHCPWAPSDLRDFKMSDMQASILKSMFGDDSPSPVAGKARDFAGQLFGVSGRYVQEAKRIKDADSKLFQSIFEGRETVSRAKALLARSVKTAHAKATAKSFRVIDPSLCDIITGDAVKEMRKLPRTKFRLAFVDPPYNLGFKYLDDPTRDDLSPDEYIQLTRECIGEIDELLTPDGTLCWMIPEEHVAMVRMVLAEFGFNVRRLIVWHESFGQNGKNNFGRTCRFIWYATKSKNEFVFDAGSILVESKRATIYGDKRAMPDGKVPDALWDFSRVAGTFSERIPDDGIPTQLPVELVKRAVRCFTEIGDSVLDPFGGTGTTARAALSCGRKCTTIERSKKYASIIRRELQRMSKPTEGKG